MYRRIVHRIVLSAAEIDDRPDPDIPVGHTGHRIPLGVFANNVPGGNNPHPGICVDGKSGTMIGGFRDPIQATPHGELDYRWLNALKDLPRSFLAQHLACMQAWSVRKWETNGDENACQNVRSYEGIAAVAAATAIHGRSPKSQRGQGVSGVRKT
jgi:hypothetical protein